jgi:hypothetical protein
MNAGMDSLTPAEAAVVAGVSMRDVHRVIDEHILPEGLYDVRVGCGPASIGGEGLLCPGKPDYGR